MTPRFPAFPLHRRPAAGEPCRPRTRARAGSTLIEAALIMVLLCLILFGAVQVSVLYAGKEVLDYSASMAARSRAVGFNNFMVYKVMRVAAIPNAGRISNPDVATSTADPAVWADGHPGELIDYAYQAQPEAPQVAVERSRVPLYLGAEHWNQLAPILDYEDWDTVRMRGMTQLGEHMVWSDIYQRFPLRFPMHRTFYRGDEVDLDGRAQMDSHYSLYLQ